MIDTHCHLNLPPLNIDPLAILSEAASEGVSTLIIPGVNFETSKKALELAAAHPSLYAAIAYHPEEAHNSPDVSSLSPLVGHDKLIAIGECGLDYAHPHDRNAQRRLFGQHITLAKSTNLPLIVHCRDAYDDLLDTIRHFATDDGNLPRFVLHCMSGTKEYLENALSMGAYISFAGNVTYPKADPLRTLLSATPLDRLLLETDAPFLPPQSHRGITNTPAHIKETYTFVANFLGPDFKDLETKVESNARTFFRLP